MRWEGAPADGFATPPARIGAAFADAGLVGDVERSVSVGVCWKGRFEPLRSQKSRLSEGFQS